MNVFKAVPLKYEINNVSSFFDTFLKTEREITDTTNGHHTLIEFKENFVILDPNNIQIDWSYQNFGVIIWKSFTRDREFNFETQNIISILHFESVNEAVLYCNVESPGKQILVLN